MPSLSMHTWISGDGHMLISGIKIHRMPTSILIIPTVWKFFRGLERDGNFPAVMTTLISGATTLTCTAPVLGNTQATGTFAGGHSLSHPLQDLGYPTEQ